MSSSDPALPLRVLGLRVQYAQAELPAVAGVDLTVGPGEVLGLIGESGSGKSTVAYSTVGYLPGAVVSGSVVVDGKDVVGMSPRSLRLLRGRRVAVVHQNPQSALNPTQRVGQQVAEQIRIHTAATAAQARERVVDLLGQVRFTEPEQVYRRYPHELSGGQQQRIVIAMALSCDPDLIIMDEPTTGLDVTTEAHIMELVRDLRRRHDTAILFISHNLPLVASIADRVAVMRSGSVVESGPVPEVLTSPQHPYTRELVGSMTALGGAGTPAAPAGRTSADPRAPQPAAAPGEPPALEAKDLVKAYRSGRSGTVLALDHVDLTVRTGRTVAVVGESGSGKTTLARCLAGLVVPDSGEVVLGGYGVDAAIRDRARRDRRAVQMVFQNPESSLNPRHTVGAIIARPLALQGAVPRRERRRRVEELLDQVSLPRAYAARRPAELSGGEKQRVAVARAFAAQPAVVLLDEPTSALDAAVQLSLLDLLRRLQEDQRVSYLFITHDFGAVRAIADEVVVMHHGRVVEAGHAQQVLSQPEQPYTRELIGATMLLPDVLARRGAA